MRRLVFGLGMLLAASSPAFAADPCDVSKWPLARDATLMDQARKVVKTGAELPLGLALVYEMKPVGKVAYPVPPTRKPGDKTFGAIARINVPGPGLYQITLSDEAGLDLVQGGKLVGPADTAEVVGCPGLYKSFRYRLEKGPATIEISGQAGDRMAIIFGTPG